MARPNDLVDVPESGVIAVQSSNNNTQSSRPTDLIDVDPDYVNQQINPYNAVTGVATGAAVLAPAIEKKILGTDPRAGRSLETYLRTQRHHEYPGLDLKGLQAEWQKVAGPNARIVTMQDVQEALKATRPVDLSSYKNAPKPTTTAGRAVQPVKKLGEAVEQLNPFLGQGYGSKVFRGAGRAGLGFGAAYEGAQAYNKALEGDVAGAAGSASTSAGLGLMAVPHPVAKGAGAILAGVPLASNLIGSANAAPMTKEEASGTAFDIATGLLGPIGMALTPSELGHGTLTKRNEISRPGKSVLEGSRLPPQGYAEGKSVQGSESNATPFIGYPHIKNKPRDPNFVQQSGPILGGLDAIIGMGKRDDVSVLTPEGRAYNEFYDKYEPVGIAASVLPFMGGPAKAVGKSAAKNLGPRAADMTENYLSKIGGVQYAVPPGKQSTFAQPTPLKSKPQKFSEAIEPFIGTHSLHPTIVDKTKLDLAAGRMAGPEAPYLQEISQPHKESGWIFANDSLGAASKLYNMGKDNKTLVTGLLGSPTQLKTNRSVFGEIADEYFKAIKEGKMTPELQAKIQARLPTLTHGKENLQTFPTQFDIRDRDAFNEMSKGFHQRGHLADIMGGKGVSQGLPRGTAKIIPYEDILMRNTEESLLGAPTHSIGSRLFTVGSKPPEYRPDLHNAFDYANFGELKSGNFGYVPKEFGYPDEIARIKANLASRGIGRDITAMDLMRNTINQPITEQMWRRAQAEGYAPGGKVLSAIKKMSEEAQAAYKAKHTPGFYHASPSNKIKAFDPNKGDRAFPTEGVTFGTRDPKFADSFLDMHRNKAGGFDYEKGSTVYPISINLGKHFVPGSPEGSELIDQFIAKMPANPDAVMSAAKRAAALKSGAWDVMEDPRFLQHLQDTGHDTFTVMEGGVPNVGVFNPANIRGKFAKYNPEDAADPDFMKAEGGLIHLAGGGKIPEAVVKAYKLFRTKGGNTDELYPLFVNANKPVPLNEWVNAEVGPVAASGKVKSKLGELAYRPGWHAGDLPVATHIGGKSAPELKAPDFRRPEEVWAEVEMPADVDWQQIANQRARLNKAGQPIASTAHITDAIPEGGFYRYKTSPNMQGNWLIGGGMKVNKVLTDEEVMAINEAAGVADLPRFTLLPKKADGGPVGYAPGGKVGGLAELAKKLMPLAEREANKATFLQPSAVKDRLYHGTTDDILAFDPSTATKKTGNVTSHFGTFLSDDPAEASRYAQQWGTKGGNVMPVHVQLQNPYNMPYKEMDKYAMGAWNRRKAEPGYDPNSIVKVGDMDAQRKAAEAYEKHTQAAIQDVLNRKQELIGLGHDGIIANVGGKREVIPFDSNKIKSAIGNAGTYDIKNPDITKKKGGKVKKK